MSRAFEAQIAAQKSYPEDRQAGVEPFLGYLDTTEKDFAYEQGQSAEEYVLR